MNYLHKRVYIGPGQHVIVEHNIPCNIVLLDQLNYTRYQNGEEFRYHGGFFNTNPAELWPPKSGQWNVVADLGGRTGSLAATVSVVND